MVRQFFHRLGPQIQRVFDTVTRTFTSGGGSPTEAAEALTPAVRNTLGPDLTSRIIGEDR